MGRSKRLDVNHSINEARYRASRMPFNPGFTRIKFKRKAIPKDIKFAVMERDSLNCIQCYKFTPISNIGKHISILNGEFHHVIPLVYGGMNTLSNICILCQECHKTVHSGRETPTKYYEMFANFVRHGWLFFEEVENG